MSTRSVLRAAGAVALTVALAGGGAVAAQAATHSVGGGTWIYYVDSNGPTNASEYYHPTAFHRATVQNPRYGMVRDYAGAGRWAAAYQRATASGNKAYWYRY